MTLWESQDETFSLLEGDGVCRVTKTDKIEFMRRMKKKIKTLRRFYRRFWYFYTFYKRISLSSLWVRLNWWVRYFNRPPVLCVAFKTGSHDSFSKVLSPLVNCFETNMLLLFYWPWQGQRADWPTHTLTVNRSGWEFHSHFYTKCDLWTAWLTTLLSICDQGLSIYTVLGPQTKDKHLLCTGSPIGIIGQMCLIFMQNLKKCVAIHS